MANEYLQEQMYMGSLGRHVLVEFYDCSPEVLNDVSLIEENMVKAAREASSTVVNSTFHHFSPFGTSGVVVIEESHLSIHTWPEYGFASMDIFTCGDSVEPWIAFNYLQHAFEAGHASSMEMRRGQLNLLDKKEDFDAGDVRDEKSKQIVGSKHKRNVWFTDRDENIALSLRHKGNVLYREKSPYQKVEIFDTYAYGRMLTCDNMVMCTEKDEYVYHEMIAHVPMLTHDQAKKILVIGGGDGGTVRELLKHDHVEEVVMVEIDEKVVEATQQHLPTIASAFDDQRLHLIIDDGIKYVQQSPSETFDLVIVDSNDPVGPAEGLFSESFYSDVHRILTQQGVMVTQSESPRFNVPAFKAIYQTFNRIFPKNQVFTYLAHIPTYPSGMWSFSYSAKGSVHPVESLDQAKAEKFLASNDLKYYNTQIHHASFALPNFVRELINVAN